MRKKCAYVWSGVGGEDIAHYLGIVMWMGIIGLPEMWMYWARNMTFSLSAFPQTMPKRRFEAIQKYFHSFNRRVIPKGNPDKLMIIRPVLDFIIGKYHSLYVPTSNLSIDEGMLKWKGRLSIRVYNPMKPIKYGIKFYFLCEAKTGYVLDCIIYRGVTSTLCDIVFNLLGRHFRQGYHVFITIRLCPWWRNCMKIRHTLVARCGCHGEHPSHCRTRQNRKAWPVGRWRTAGRTTPWFSFGRTYDWCRVSAQGSTPARKISPTDEG